MRRWNFADVVSQFVLKPIGVIVIVGWMRRHNIVQR